MKAHIDRQQKNSRFLYFFQNVAALAIPSGVYRRRLHSIFNQLTTDDITAMYDTVLYYNRVRSSFRLLPDAKPFRLSLFKGRSNYFLDLHEYAKYFDPTYRMTYRFGDVTHVPDTPTIVKSRPIRDDNQHSILLNLNKVRHFVFADDHVPFEKKIDKIVWRGRAFQPHRKLFLERYHNHPRCDVGHFHKKSQDVPWVKPYLSIPEQLAYKFVLAIEGNDVASNLKWVMSSQSIAMMPRPRYETWYREGQLIPGRHFILLKDDFSDLEEKIDYYATHTEEARAIIVEANRWVDQFRDRDTERLISLLVLWKYFYDSGQTCQPPPGYPA